MNETNWIPGLLVLAASVVAGILFVLGARRRPTVVGGKSKETRVDDGSANEDLEQRYQTLLSQLRELKADRHHLSADEYAAEKNRLEHSAAEALKAKHSERAKPTTEVQHTPQTDNEPSGLLSRNPQLKGALWGGGLVLFFVMLGILLGQETKPPRSSMGQEPGSAPSSDEAPENTALKTAMERLDRNPNDIEALSDLSHELIGREDFAAARRLTDRAIGIDPFHIQTRIHRTVLRALETGGTAGIAELERLGAMYPGAHEALLFAGALSGQNGDKARQLKNFERFAAEATPDEQAPELQRSIQMLREELGSNSSN